MTEEASAASVDTPQPQTFRERKLAELSAERPEREEEVNYRPDADPSDRTPEPSDSTERVEDDLLPDEQDQYTDEDVDEDPQEAPSDDSEDEEGQDAGNWEKRYKDTQAKLTEVSEERNAIEREYVENIESNMRLKHDLEDQYQRVEDFFKTVEGGLSQQVAQLEEMFRTGQVPPEDINAKRDQYYGMVNQRQQFQQALANMQQERESVEKRVTERRAEITRARLARTIPDWSPQKYAEMRTYAAQNGYSEEEFNKEVDHRFFELLNKAMLLDNASSTVQKVRRKRRTKTPSGARNMDRQPRDARGRFRLREAEKAFKENPNERGRFAAMKLEQLQRENR